jgi:hypothetical protein
MNIHESMQLGEVGHGGLLYLLSFYDFDFIYIELKWRTFETLDKIYLKTKTGTLIIKSDL